MASACYTEKAPNAWQRRGTQKTITVASACHMTVGPLGSGSPSPLCIITQELLDRPVLIHVVAHCCCCHTFDTVWRTGPTSGADTALASMHIPTVPCCRGTSRKLRQAAARPSPPPHPRTVRCVHELRIFSNHHSALLVVPPPQYPPVPRGHPAAVTLATPHSNTVTWNHPDLPPVCTPQHRPETRCYPEAVVGRHDAARPYATVALPLQRRLRSCRGS